jgi:hypothetical protein
MKNRVELICKITKGEIAKKDGCLLSSFLLFIDKTGQYFLNVIKDE